MSPKINIPEESWPRCIYCGTIIGRSGVESFARWMVRKVCTRKTDRKEVTCHSRFMAENAITRNQMYKGQINGLSNKHKAKPKIVDGVRQRMKTKRCPICRSPFDGHDEDLHCQSWECRLAEKKCIQWQIPLSEYHAERNRRDAEQRRINDNQSRGVRIIERVLCL
ncbi:MAG: hypothetical protein HGA87_01115 [Desulfobulbaceae bacterium]|nr:hypothetical protein [Desulfobulbaceae bacterium]